MMQQNVLVLLLFYVAEFRRVELREAGANALCSELNRYSSLNFNNGLHCTILNTKPNDVLIFRILVFILNVSF